MSDKACSVGCGHPPDDHEDGKCMHLCDCAWPSAEKESCWNDMCSLPLNHKGKHRPYGLPAEKDVEGDADV